MASWGAQPILLFPCYFYTKHRKCCKFPLRTTCCILWSLLSEKSYYRSELFDKIHSQVYCSYYFFISLVCWWHNGVDQELQCHGDSPAVKRTSFEVLTSYYSSGVGVKVSKLSFLQLGHTDMKESSRNIWLLKIKLRNSLWIVSHPMTNHSGALACLLCSHPSQICSCICLCDIPIIWDRAGLGEVYMVRVLSVVSMVIPA